MSFAALILGALVIAGPSPVQPVAKPPVTQIAPAQPTKGGEAAEPADQTRSAAPGQVSALLREILPRIGEPLDVSAEEHEALDGVVAALKAEQTETARKRWTKLVRAHRARTGRVDVAALVQYVLRKSYLENNEDLRHHAAKIKAYNEAKAQVREHLQKVRAATKGKSGKTGISMPTLVVAKALVPGTPAARAGGSKTMTAAEWSGYVADIEAKLQSVGDDAQLANVDLQNVLQKQQQVLQMMSNISKMLHDTAMAITRKMGGGGNSSDEDDD